MTPSLDPIAVIILLGAAHGLCLALIILRRDRAGRATPRILAGSLAVISLVIAGATFLYHAKYFLIVPHLAEMYVPFTFLVGPLLYFYVKSLTTPSFRFRKRDLLHLLPFLVYHSYLIPFYVQDAAYKIAYLKAAQQSMPLAWRISSGLFLLHLMLYIGCALRVWHRCLNQNKTSFSAGEPRSRLSARTLMLGVSGFCLVFLLRYLIDFRVETLYVGPLLIATLVFGIGYLGLLKPALLFPAGSNQASDAHVPLQRQKYEKSTLTPAQADLHLRTLLDVMNTEKSYIDHDLSLQKLATHLDLPSHHLSQIINEQCQQNFFDFVNGYRIEAAKRALLDPAYQHLTIMAIAQEVGFNARTTFYAAFKKHVGMTPSQYKRKAQAFHDIPRPSTRKTGAVKDVHPYKAEHIQTNHSVSSF